MINGDSFFEVVSKQVYGEGHQVSIDSLREMAVNHILRDWPLFPEIADILEYSNRMIQPGAPVDRYMMEALATELNLDITVYVDGYVVEINGPENTINTNVDLFVAETDYILLEDVFGGEGAFEGDDVLVDIEDVLQRVLAQDDALLFRTMVDAGIIDINEVDVDGNNILYSAVMEGASGIIIMLAYKFGIYNGIIDYVLESDSSTLLDSLIDAGIIDINEVDVNGNTLLHLAVMGGAVEIAAVLVHEWGFNVEYVNNEGNIAVDYAAFPVMDYVLGNLSMEEVVANWGPPIPAAVDGNGTNYAAANAIPQGYELYLGGEVAYNPAGVHLNIDHYGGSFVG